MNGTNAETSQRERLLSFPWHVLKSFLLLGREQQSRVHGVDFPAACACIFPGIPQGPAASIVPSAFLTGSLHSGLPTVLLFF